MKGDDFIGHSPDTVFFLSEDGQSIYFKWNPEKDFIASYYKIDLKGLTSTKFGIEELKDMPSKNGVYSKDRNKKLYEKNGDIFLYNIKSGQVNQITNTVEKESDPVFTNNDQNSMVNE